MHALRAVRELNGAPLAATGALLLSSNAAMRLRLSDPDLVPELLQFLESRLEMVSERVSENEVELSLLGSYNREAERMTVDLVLRAWEAGRDVPVSVEFID
jgi:hypothetical protein